MRKTSLIFLGALVGVVATLLLTQPHTLLMGSAARATASDTYRTLNLFGDVFEVVRAAYVEKPEDGKLVESAINGMLAGLDPHSAYMNPHSFRDMQVQTRGGFGGLGIEVTMATPGAKHRCAATSKPRVPSRPARSPTCLPNESDDKAIKMALDLLRGSATNAAFPPNPKAVVHN